MHISDVFSDQARARADSVDGVEHGMTFLCFDTGRGVLALPLEQAREIVEHPVVVAYPVSAGRHIGIANVRGTVVPVLSLADEQNDQQPLVVLESSDGRPFSLLVGSVSTATVIDRALTELVRAPTVSTGIARIGGEPLRWVTTSWLEQTLIAGEL